MSWRHAMPLLALASLCVTSALAAEPGRPADVGTSNAPQVPAGATPLVRPTLIDPDINQIDHAGNPRLRFSDEAPVNGGANAGLAPTYLGQPTFHNAGSIRADGAHIQITGYTRGWDAGTCLFAVQANAPAGSSGCNQGGFWDPSYRAVYPGQDSAAGFFSINGIKPVVKDAVVEDFGRLLLTNPAGEEEEVGTLTLATPLHLDQIASINDASGPMRVQVVNGFFGYALPQGFTLHGRPIMPVSDDGKTMMVDNWTRAVEPTNSALAGKLGGKATDPSLPYWTPSGVVPGTGVLPNQVGETNGSQPLPQYRVTVDSNSLAEALYGGFRITNDDVTSAARFVEMVGVNNKTGKPAWDETEPLNDQIEGRNVITHLIFGGCQNDDGLGLGTCGAMLFGTGGLKRVVVCDNPQTTEAGGATDCVLDTKSTVGWKSTKTSGYVMWIDPGATGKPRMLADWNGNVNTAGRIFVGSGDTGIKLEPSGDVIASSVIVPGRFYAAMLPACSASTIGGHVFVVDARKPGEMTGNGSGVPADCAPIARGREPSWISVYDRMAVSH